MGPGTTAYRDRARRRSEIELRAADMRFARGWQLMTVLRLPFRGCLDDARDPRKQSHGGDGFDGTRHRALRDLFPRRPPDDFADLCDALRG